MTRPRLAVRIVRLIRDCTSITDKLKVLALYVLELLALVYVLVWFLRR